MVGGKVRCRTPIRCGARALLIGGPRQCGKSTLVRRLLPDLDAFDLEQPVDAVVLGRNPQALANWHRRGASFEGLIVEEVDLLVDAGRGLVPIEVKMGAAIGGSDVAGLRHCMSDLGLKHGFVVSATASEHRELGRGIEVVPWRDVLSGDCDLGL